MSSLLDGEFQRPRNGRKNDKAHPPIHPTNAANNLDGDEKRVYELVTRRFLASCHRNAEGKTTTVEIDIAGEAFSASGKPLFHPRQEYASSQLETDKHKVWSFRRETTSKFIHTTSGTQTPFLISRKERSLCLISASSKMVAQRGRIFSPRRTWSG